MALQDVEECLILERLNRFTLRVKIGGQECLAFLQNTGRLMEYVVHGRRGFCIPIKKPKKLSRRLFAISEGGLAAIVDTYLQSRAFEEAISRDLIPWLRGCWISRKDVPLAGTKIDYLMTCELKDVLVELKSAALRLGSHASYPDCPSERAARQVRKLLEVVKRGTRAILVFIAAIPHIKGFKLNCEADPALCELIVKAHAAGIEIRSIQLVYDPSSSSIMLLNPDLPTEI